MASTSHKVGRRSADVCFVVTWKGFHARYIHDQSQCGVGLFVAINCVVISGSLQKANLSVQQLVQVRRKLVLVYHNNMNIQSAS